MGESDDSGNANGRHPLSRQAHSTVVQRVLMYVSELGWRLFKNHVGSAWHGIVGEEFMISDKRGKFKVIELRKAYMITYGLRPGSSDLVGWQTVKITPDMVGDRIAQFCAIECKTGQYATITAEQRNFLQVVRKAGGYAAVAQLNGKEVILKEVEKDE